MPRWQEHMRPASDTTRKAKKENWIQFTKKYQTKSTSFNLTKPTNVYCISLPSLSLNEHKHITNFSHIWPVLKIAVASAGRELPVWRLLEVPGWKSCLRCTKVTERRTPASGTYGPTRLWWDRRWQPVRSMESHLSWGQAIAVEASVNRSREVLRVRWCYTHRSRTFRSSRKHICVRSHRFWQKAVKMESFWAEISQPDDKWICFKVKSWKP